MPDPSIADILRRLADQTPPSVPLDRRPAVMRQPTIPETVNDLLLQFYQAAAEHPIGRISDALGLSDVQGMAHPIPGPSMLLSQIGGKTGRGIRSAENLARARAMGFHANMPLYHGTASDIRAFDLATGGRTSASSVGPMGVSTTGNPELAAEFADRAARSGNGQNILPLLHRANRPAQIDLTGQETNHQIAATVAQAWEDGYDAVLIRNYTSPRGTIGQVVIVKDPAQLRSRFAAFDPSKILSPDLLASLGGATVVGASMD